MKAVITRSTAKGRTGVPPSKSYSHRALLAAGLGEGDCILEGVLSSEDIYATLECLEALGAVFDRDGDRIRIKGAGDDLRGLKRVTDGVTVNCRESGSTLRFMIPIFLTGEKEVKLEGYGRLFQRPMTIYEDICREQGLLFSPYENGIRIKGPLKPGTYSVPGNVSSQFITGLLYALSLLEEDSVLEVTGKTESYSYIKMTMEVLEDFGVKIRQDGNRFYIPGKSVYRNKYYRVEGDYSNAAFLDGFNVLGGQVQLTNLKENSLQGDRIYREYYVNLDKDIPMENRPVMDLEDCPDLGPVLIALAACTGGGTFSGTARLKIKESDRGEAMAEELVKFGITVLCDENKIRVLPGELQKPAKELNAHNDHRIAMALALVCSRTGGIIADAQCVNKSYPGFWDDIKGLGIGVQLI